MAIFPVFDREFKSSISNFKLPPVFDFSTSFIDHGDEDGKSYIHTAAQLLTTATTATSSREPHTWSRQMSYNMGQHQTAAAATTNSSSSSNWRGNNDGILVLFFTVNQHMITPYCRNSASIPS
jgi:hypothetical protein